MMRKILLVEDEPSIADNILYALKTEGFAPTWCQTGQEAVARLKQESFALVILDVGLPDVNGFELCKSIRATSAVPVVFVTARKDEIDKVVGLEIGADDYVVKPFAPRELTARIKAILRRTDSAPPPLSQVAPTFALDEERCEIRYHGAPCWTPRARAGVASRLNAAHTGFLFGNASRTSRVASGLTSPPGFGV